MSPKLKPLLLPQLVEERRSKHYHNNSVYSTHDHHDFVYYTTNSSSSDITSPVTPTFSHRGHQRYSSSSSSLDLPLQLQDSPSSPIPPTSNKSNSIRQLPDVQEEPMERDDDTATIETVDEDDDHFGLYSCLCDEPCQHRRGSDGMLPGNHVADFDSYYDLGFLSDCDYTVGAPQYAKKRSGVESPLHGLTTRFNTRFAGIKPWKSSRRSNLMSSPTTDMSFENVLSRPTSSRDSSMSAPRRHFYDRSNEPALPPTPAMSYHASTESIPIAIAADIEHHQQFQQEERSSLERERALATTPLLPPLLTDPLGKPAPEELSPLQSPSVAPSPAATGVSSPVYSSAQFSRPTLSTKPSVSSFRHISGSTELPLPLPAILQEHDEWSDRLGHANFTITPLPYELESINAETVGKFCQDWDAARINYTKHLVRTGENYGQTSKIYALTEAKWAETERRWRNIYDGLITQTMAANRSLPPSAAQSRSRSRGRGRGRAGSAGTSIVGRPPTDDIFANMQWRRLEDAIPSAVPQMLEALDADGKFPNRGDVDIVGPMHRDEVMIRADSEERKSSRFWRHLADKVGLRK
ncbi:hypothetical protein HJFPF1_08084 [Paramyrothecium foliicola]|nr:hypothetical protein HJFPF1_08084 [Paramyrothecium foliicola]